MAYKFPWTNYHELNLDWILDTVKKLFAQTEQNNAVVEQYDGRLTEVELTADNAQTAAEQAQSDSAAALSLAQNAQTTATQAQQAAGQAQQAAGQAQTAAGQAQEAAATAQQTATQAQQTAQNFDGRITQAENNAASALQAAQAFDEQVQGAITAANNANEAATTALTTATETARELAAQRDTLEDIIENAEHSLEVDLSTKADVIYNTASGNIASFNDGADDMNIRNLIVNIEPAQAGSGDPSPDNVRPISGHSGANIERRGKNLLKPFAKSVGIITRLEDGRIVINGTATGVQWLENSPVNAFHVKAGTYTLSGASSNAIQLYINYSYDNWATRIESVHNILQPVTITFERDAQIYLQCQVLSGTYDVIIYPQLELGSTATTYEPYTGNQISVNWEDEAGTIYGGILDLISGDLIVNYRYITIDGTNIRCTGGYGAAGPLYLPLVSISNYKSVSPWTCYCDKLKPTSISAELQSTDNTISVGNAGNGIALHIAGIQGTDGSQGYNSTQEVIDAANTWLQSNPITVCYLLETDTHYDITPQEVKTLYQYNNIWSDAGSVNVEYPADTKTYIDNKFAELQALILEH